MCKPADTTWKHHTVCTSEQRGKRIYGAHCVGHSGSDDRIVRVELSADFARGTVDTGFGDPSFIQPTTIAKAGDRLLVVNSQFQRRGGVQAQPNAPPPQLPFTVANVRIPPSDTASASTEHSPNDPAPTATTAEATRAASASNTGPPALPAPVQCYVDAVNTANLDTLVACFAPDAVVTDVGRRIEGAAAIRTWADREVIGGTLQVIESAPQENGVRLLVQFAPRGSNGWRAYYTFTYENDRITHAELQYA